MNGSRAQRDSERPRLAARQLILAPELKSNDQVSWAGHVRLLNVWGSPIPRRTWLAKVASQLPEPGSADVLFLQAGSPLAKPSILAPWLGAWRQLGGKLVLEHGGEAFPDTQARSARQRQLDQYHLDWLACAADAVIVPSRAVGKSLGSASRRLIVVPTYLDSATWPLARREPSEDGAISTMQLPVRLGFIGVAHERRHLELIAPAIRRLEAELGEKISVEIVGTFESSTPLFGRRIALPKNQSYDDYVQWLNRRTNWDIGLAPVRAGHEFAGDVGQKILQYSALGLATVASNRVESREFIRHQQTGLLVEDGSEEWYRTLRRLVESADARRRLVGEAQQRLARFTVEANGRRYLDVLDEICSLPPRVDSPRVPGKARTWGKVQLRSVLAAAGVGRPELDVLRRKRLKLARDPHAFFADSRSPFVRGVGSLLLRGDSNLAGSSGKVTTAVASRAPQPAFGPHARLLELIESLPLPERSRRKCKKLVRDPEAFFADSPSQLVKKVGSLLGAGQPRAAGRSDARVLVSNDLAIDPSRTTAQQALRSGGKVTEPDPTSQASAPAGRRAGAASPTIAQPRLHAERVQKARKLLLKIEKTVLGNLNELHSLAKAPPRLEALSGTDLPGFAKVLYASTHVEQITSTARDLARDVSVMKELLAAFPERPTEPSAQGSGYAADLRTKILRGIPKVAGQLNTPYYPRLIDAVSELVDPQLLSEVWSTLREVDLARYGHVPRADGPFVSVVMPVYNRRDVVTDAVASVLAQTYPHLELLVCDDASADDTAGVLATIHDGRIKVLRHDQRRGAAAARNTCLAVARGEFVAYLDSDNLWHPRFLELMLEALARSPGNVAAYASYFDVTLNEAGRASLKKAEIRSFHLEDQLDVPFVDLNSFIHRRELCEVFGVFDERLVRRQDYDIISRYCWIREPHQVPRALNIYQRIPNLEQITRTTKGDVTAPALIREKIDAYYSKGLPARFPSWLKKVSVISWDMSRNHFAKAFCVAEALSEHLEVELISFRFFEAPIFEPLAQVNPKFELKSFDGAEFPEFFDNFARAVNAISGDLIYAVKPRLPSLGVAMMANYHTGKPIFLEVNDLETVVASPRSDNRHVELPLESVLDELEQAKTPHSLIWSQVLDPCVAGIPTVYTHNVNLNIHYGRRCLYMRNIKDDAIYDPGTMDRDALRRQLGYGPDDRIILFGGLVRKHKGVFELAEVLKKLDDPRYKLLVVASRETSDVRALASRYGHQVSVLSPQSPRRMAELNHAADLVVLWLDPSIAAGHYQSPYKISDALAMGPAVIASPTSDQANFAERELVWTVPFGDFSALVSTIKAIFADDRERKRRRERGRRLFLREFSYKSVPASLALGASLVRERGRVYPVSARFAQLMNDFHGRLRST